MSAFNRVLNLANISRGNKVKNFGKLLYRTSIGSLKKTTVPALVKKFEEGQIIIPEYQRNIEDDIINGMMETCREDPKLLTECSNAIHLYQCGNGYALVDGQHRLEVYRRLLEENEDIFDDIKIKIHIINKTSTEKLLSIYKNLNYNNTDAYINTSSIVDITESEKYYVLKTKILESFSKAFTSNLVIYTINAFMNKLIEVEFLDYYDDVDDAINDIMERNNLFHSFYEDIYDSLTESEKLLHDEGYVMSFKRNNYIDFLLVEDVDSFEFKHTIPAKGRKTKKK